MKKPAKKTHFTVNEAAEELGITHQAVREAISKGRLKAKKGEIVQTVWLIPTAALDEYRGRVSRSHQKRGKKSEIA
jgi:excisionase family DNA binding protein